MATEITVHTPTPPYFNEDGVPQLNTPVINYLTEGINYIVSMKSGNVLFVFEHGGEVESADLTIRSSSDSFGRLADINITIDGGFQDANKKYTRIFTRRGWADGNGYIHFSVVGTGVTFIAYTI